MCRGAPDSPDLVAGGWDWGNPAANPCVPLRGRGPRSGEGLLYGTWRKWLGSGSASGADLVAGGWGRGSRLWRRMCLP